MQEQEKPTAPISKSLIIGSGLVLLTIIGGLGYMYWDVSNKGNVLSEQSTQATPTRTPTPTKRPEQMNADDKIQAELKIAAEAFEKCAIDNQDLFEKGKCDSIANLTKSNYYKQQYVNTNFKVVGTDDHKVGMIFAKADDQKITCEYTPPKGGGNNRYHVYRSIAKVLRIECWSGEPPL
ncbi:hypothetical protein HGA91_03845 [candidate division WWE3 bacterium]|nr:hypothetical protein [candidate division WWE3 bacterium]